MPARPESPEILIWDCDEPLPAGEWTAILWRSYATGSRPDVFSIPQLIEEHATGLRSRYLELIYELGELRIRGARLVDLLKIRDGFSYWWMTLFAEKCNYSKSPQIDDVIRLMAFEGWARQRTFQKLVLVTSSGPLAESISMWCDRMSVCFERQRIARPQNTSSWLQRLHQLLPHGVRAWLWLFRYLINRWPLRGIGLKEWEATDGTATFCSYLFNLDPEAVRQGRYESRFWTVLPETLGSHGIKTNWLHLYHKDAVIPTARHAAETLRNFNRIGAGLQRHVALDSFLCPRLVMRTLSDWWCLSRVSRGLAGCLSSKRNGNFNFWPLFEEDWRQSMVGTDAMSNLLTLNLLEAAFSGLPTQGFGAYLQENQSWEFALISTWKRLGHGRLNGVPHSTIRFWDLRYYFDPRNYRRQGPAELPMPDKVAYNGSAMKNALIQGGYPQEDLVEVEALRYLHLSKSNHATSCRSKTDRSGLRVLVLGEYLFEKTQRQLRLLEQAAPLMAPGTVFLVKPHPACPIRADAYQDLRLETTTEPISNLLADCDVAYSSPVTSAAVDAYLSGVPVVSMLDSETLNLSPLYGCSGVFFASSPEELAAALSTAMLSPFYIEDRRDFFTIDPKLPRWLNLLQFSATRN